MILLSKSPSIVAVRLVQCTSLLSICSLARPIIPPIPPISFAARLAVQSPEADSKAVTTGSDHSPSRALQAQRVSHAMLSTRRQRPLSISRSPSRALHLALSILRSPIPAPSARFLDNHSSPVRPYNRGAGAGGDSDTHAMFSTRPLLHHPSILPPSFVPRSAVQSRSRHSCQRRQQR